MSSVVGLVSALRVKIIIESYSYCPFLELLNSSEENITNQETLQNNLYLFLPIYLVTNQEFSN